MIQNSLLDQIFEPGESNLSVKPRSILDDPESAIRAKHSAIAQVQRNANPEWLDAFRQALERVARSQYRFTSDAIWEEFERQLDRPSQHEPRAAGAVVVKAIKDGVIVPEANLFWRSTSPRCHNRPKRVYRSLIYSGERG